MSPYILPTFHGYTVDLRLREFRRAVPHELLEFIPFETTKGQRLLTELKKYAVKVMATDN